MIYRILSFYLSFLLIIDPRLVSALEPGKDALNMKNTVPAEARQEAENPVFEVVYQSDTKAKRDLIVVVDAHSSLSAQYNINAILEQYSIQDNLHAVYLEGASGILNPAQFAVFDDERVTQPTADFLLQNRFITGAEYFGMTSEQKITFKGAESADSYEENLKRFAELKSMTDKVHLEQLIDILNDRMRSKENERFAQLDQLYTTVLTSGQNLIPFVNEFYDYYCFGNDNLSSRFPLAASVVYSIKKSAHVQNLIQKSLARLANYLMANGLNADDLNQVKYLLLYTDTPGFAEKAYELFEKYPAPLIPAMIKEIKEYNESSARLKSASSNDIYLEIIRAYRSFYCELEGTALFDARDALFGILKGSKLNLTPEELSYFKVDQFDPGVYIEFLSGSESITPAQLSGWVDELEKIHALSSMIVRFYSAVEERNDSIFTTINTDLPDDKSALLIVGGYHREIFEKFQRNGFNVTVIRPEIDFTAQSQSDLDYLDQLYGSFSSIEKMIYYSWSPIVHRLVSQQASGFRTRKAASKVFTTEYIALMTGAAVQVLLNESEGLNKYETIARIQETFAGFFNTPAHKALVDSYLNLPGTEFVPRKADIVDYQKIADGKGFVVVFKIGGEAMAVQWMPAGTELTGTEQDILASIPGYRPKNKITVQDTAYDISFVHIPAQTPVLNRLKNFGSAVALSAMIVAVVGLASGFLNKNYEIRAESIPAGLEFSQEDLNMLSEYNEQLQAGLKQEQIRTAQSASNYPAVEAQLKLMEPLNVSKIADSSDIVFFSDDHPVIQIAGLLLDSLEGLQKQGFTQLALELNSDFQPMFDRWNQRDRQITLDALKKGMDRKMGLGIAENTVALIDKAKQLGMRVVAYDVPDREQYGGTTSLDVEVQWYKTLDNSLSRYGGKMAVLSGEFHMIKDRRAANQFFFDGNRKISVIFFTGGEIESVTRKGYSIDPLTVRMLTAVESSGITSRVMIPIPEDVNALYYQNELAKKENTPSYVPQEPRSRASLTRTNWVVVLPEAAYAPLPQDNPPQGPGFYVDAGAARQSMKEIMQLKYSFINPHLIKLQEMGVVEEDIASLLGITDKQLIAGEFGTNPMNTVVGNNVHSYIVSSFQRETMNRILNKIGPLDVAVNFKGAMIDQLSKRGMTPEQADKRFYELRDLLAQELRVKSDPASDMYHFASDIDFVMELIDFYFNSRMTGDGTEFFNNPLFRAEDTEFLVPVIQNALGDKYFGILNFAPTAPVASDTYRAQQVAFVQSMYDRAVELGIPATELSIFMMQRPDGGEALKLQMKRDTQKVSDSITHRGVIESSL
ncbi:MAG: hypothetical protein AB1454_12310 [Candidatus Auribacterota bacterium]